MSNERLATIDCPACGEHEMSVSMSKKNLGMGWCEICATQLLTKNGLGSRGLLLRAGVKPEKKAPGRNAEKSDAGGDEEAPGPKPDKEPPKEKAKSGLDEMF